MAPPVFPGDADEAASSYLHLSRIALLMEEQEADDVAELSPDHPALLHAQLPFSQILSGAPFSPDQDPVFPGHRGSPYGGGHVCYTDTGTVIGYVDTHFPKKHQYGDTARIINNYI